jgi:hypothetical protein
MELISTKLHQQNISGGMEPDWDISINARHSVIYAGAFIFITIVINFLFGNSLKNGLPSIAGRCIFTGLFLLTGVVHNFSFSKLLAYLYSGDTVKGLIFSFVLAFLISDFILLLFFIRGIHRNELAVAAGCAFILPYIVNQCRQYYLGIEKKEYKNWVIPADAEPDKRKSLLLNSIFFKIKIKIKYFDIGHTIFNVNLPKHLALSEVFYRFLYDQEYTVETVDNNKQPFAWRFSVKTHFGNKILDPDISLEKNGIKESDIILIERIKV